MRYIGLIALGLMGLTLVFPILPVIAQDTITEEIPRDMPIFEPSGGWGRLRIGILLNISFEDALKLAYTIRNLTYELFQWEISYNIIGAKVQLERGDWFLMRAINISQDAPRRATILAFVASIHYSHAPALANPVLSRVIYNNLGENNTITNDTVIAVLNTASELRELLVNAINYAQNLGYNTTISEYLLQIGDERISNATTHLEEDNVLLAFRQAVSGYRTYVRAFAVLVRSVYVQIIKEIKESITATFMEYKEPPAKTLAEVLPIRIREHIRARIEGGEVKTVGEVVRIMNQEMATIRIQLRAMEKENLKRIAWRIMERYNLSAIEIVLKIETYYSQGYRGIDLAKKVLEDIKSKLEQHGYRNGISIPEFPPRGPVVIQPIIPRE